MTDDTLQATENVPTNQSVESTTEVQADATEGVPTQDPTSTTASQPTENPSTPKEAPPQTDSHKASAEGESDSPATPKPKVKPVAAGEKSATPTPAPEKPKKAAPPPDPRVEAAKEVAQKLKATLVTSVGEHGVEDVGAAHITPMVRIHKSTWSKAALVLRDHPDWKLNYVECMAATDYPDYIEIVLYIQSTTQGHFVCLKTRTERDGAEVPSLADIYPAVNWEEREIFDLLGVNFTDHPDLRRIMMWDEFKGHPLRKDYNEWDSEEEDADGTD